MKLDEDGDGDGRRSGGTPKWGEHRSIEAIVMRVGGQQRDGCELTGDSITFV